MVPHLDSTEPMDARTLALRGLAQFRALLARPLLLNAALAGVLGWQLAGLTWQALPAAAALPPPSAAPAQHAAEDPEAPPPAARLARLSLFGQPPAPEPEQPADAPETELDLVLRGIYAAGGGAGVAVIAAGDEAEAVYSVGDRIADSARITAIFPDRVMLRRGDGAEILRLPSNDAEGTSSADDVPDQRSQARG